MEKKPSQHSIFSFIQQRYIFALIGVFLALLALLSGFNPGVEPGSYVGSLLVWAAILEILHAFKRSEGHERISGWISGGITLLIGILLINYELFQPGPLVNLIAVLLTIDAFRYLISFLKHPGSRENVMNSLLPGLGNLIIVLLILIFKGKGFSWIVALGGALRILGTVLDLFAAKLGDVDEVSEDILSDLGIEEDEEVAVLARQLEEEESQNTRIDIYWIVVILLTLFFIHLGRMGFDRSSLGIVSPLVAVIGDMFIALVISFGLIGPVRSLFSRLNTYFIKLIFGWIQKVPEPERKAISLRTLADWWVKSQLKLSISMRKSSYSIPTALRNGLKIGLPFAAIFAAIMPVLGMSWYFDTENWASGIWDGYSGSRTEVWREAMIKASGEKPGPEAFKLEPEGVPENSDFSFVIIGDPGEGDASQLILKDQLLAVSNKEDIQFVVISSDIVYPSGAMRDYERKFFMPFKGIQKPIYAIPGNHDWYDALEGFAATFFTPEAAIKAMEARIESERILSKMNSENIQDLVKQASYLRKEYQLPVGYQNAPFFQISNDHFVFLAIDTGVRRKVDSAQLAWIRSVLEASKDKYIMALLGHPFFAIGEYQGDMSPDFKALHQLLREYKVPLVMAGDTHDLEYYKELPQNKDGHTMHHFVNGGGGAYLSIGAAMAKPEEWPTRDWASYPARDPLVKKIDSLTPGWKYPAWIWVKKYDGYPFSAEWLSAAFDYNKAPYFQSFMEIKVEKSRNRIRLIPYGIHGQLRWGDFQAGGMGIPEGAEDKELAEWVFPMN
ncbi:hypothetical protein E0K83_12560 [Gramella sp. BOM4]|nr:hypothetical protein [Christiangramia bathymodioli]